jgi:hypothetical protein
MQIMDSYSGEVKRKMIHFVIYSRLTIDCIKTGLKSVCGEIKFSVDIGEFDHSAATR